MVSFAEIQRILTDLYGKDCCRQCVGRGRNLSIGFGQKVLYRRSQSADYYYGEWEIGTYLAAWRITYGEKILLGSHNTVDSVSELNHELQGIKLGKLIGIVSESVFDVVVKLDNDVAIKFMYASSEEDEVFHIFCPNNLYVEYTVKSGWKIGLANTPWR